MFLRLMQETLYTSQKGDRSRKQSKPLSPQIGTHMGLDSARRPVQPQW